MINKQPFLSIVIPTQQRHETLYYTIKTILNQNFDDLEIIIGDNNSTKETKEIIDNLNSSKISYFRSNVDLSLSDSYEFSVSKAVGEYIMVIADNDGFIEGGLEFLIKLLIINNYPKVINLVKNNYNWPCLRNGTDNTLTFKNTIPSLELINGIHLIQTVLDNNREFYKLPMIYNSIIHKSLIDEMRTTTGRIFNSVTPDVYSGFCIAYLTKNFLKLNYPVTIAGNSSKSLGVNYTSNNNEIIQKETISRINSEIKLHTLTPLVISHSSHIADCFLRAQENLNMAEFKFDRKKMLVEILDDLFYFKQTELDFAIKTIINSCDDDEKLQNEIIKLIECKPPRIKQINQTKSIPIGFMANSLRLDGKIFKLNNIEDVSKFMKNFYHYSSNLINYPNVLSNFENIAQNKSIAIWGQGALGKDLMDKIKETRKDLNIICIIDSFKQSFDTIPYTITPDNIPKGIDYIIIASSFGEDISKLIQKYSLHETIEILAYNKDFI